MKIYINHLSTKENWKIAKKYIQKKNLDLDFYPKIKEFAEMSFFNFYFHEFTWEQCEERFAHKLSLLARLAHGLFLNGKKDEALSIIKRHMLINSDFLSKELKEMYEVESEHFKMVPNKLFDHDEFAPYEVVYYQENENNYILLKNYGFDEKDITIIDKDDFTLKEAFEILLSSKIVFNFFDIK